MEPPADRDFGAVHTEKAKVFEAMRPLKPDDVVRGQYAGYRKEPDVAKNSDVETFCALRLFIDSWRWEGVPWYLRSGKYLADTATEVLVELKPPPQRLLGDAMNGDGALFTREDAVEAAWAVVDPVLNTHHRVRPYKRGSWGPKEADANIAPDGGWHNPKPKEASGG
jgi:glucose-6-phosphate 1-dehydrogenase